MENTESCIKTERNLAKNKMDFIGFYYPYANTHAHRPPNIHTHYTPHTHTHTHVCLQAMRVTSHLWSTYSNHTFAITSANATSSASQPA